MRRLPTTPPGYSNPTASQSALFASTRLLRIHAYLRFPTATVSRLDAQPCLISDSDEELLIKVTFASPVHIRRIMVIGGGAVEHHPSFLKVFAQSEDIDFSSASDSEATQEFDLAANVEGEGFVTTRQGPFTNVTSVAFYFT